MHGEFYNLETSKYLKKYALHEKISEITTFCFRGGKMARKNLPHNLGMGGEVTLKFRKGIPFFIADSDYSLKFM